MSSAINKAELISKLQTLEGLSNEERSSLIGLLRQHKKYGLVWEDKTENIEERLREELPVLREVKEKALLSEEPDAPNHILIEGDNLEALTALSYTHEGKIDVIYIDPPYNTGNKDFVYNDSFVDTEDSYRHSKWLSFMNKRLKIAKKLLSEKGVIFISIDDNEQANLRLLCDGIFGAANFIANIIWEKADSPRMDAKIISSRHDFIVTYAKDIATLPLNKLKVADVPGHYNKTDEKGRKYYLKPLRYMGNADRREDRPNMYFPIIAPDGTSVLPIRADGSDGRWRWSREKVEEEKNRLEFVKTKKGWSVNTRLYADNMSDIPVETLWYNKDVESNRQAIATIKQIFGSEKTFTNPKPVKLIQRIIQITGDDSSVVLDFFAGSGTSLHATMQLNAEEGGHRKCILVTSNENNICEDVTYERNKRVIDGYTTPNGVEVPGLKANSLRYYKTDYIPRERTQKNMRALVAAATDLLCIKENLYEEQKTFGRFKLKPQLARYFNDGKKHMLIIYREELIDVIAEEIKTLDVGKMRLKIYVFSPGRYAFTDNFREVEDKVELIALPAAIYDAYQKVLPKRREKLFDEENKQDNVIPSDLFAEQEEGGEA
jgi:adenine-specific DNA-methyltransferase